MDPLTTLDEIIWKQFEKVTVKANKELGWNKYDLARITDAVSAVAYTGLGFYIGSVGYLSDNPVVMAFGAIGVTASPFIYRSDIKKNNQKEEKEIAFLERNGAPKQPTFRPIRPICLGIGSYYFAWAAKIFYYGETEIPETVQNISQYEDMTTLMLGMGGFCVTSNVISNYFKDQIMKPPTKKKSFWKTLYNKATEPFRPKPEPIPIPVDNEYKTIDSIL